MLIFIFYFSTRHIFEATKWDRYYKRLKSWRFTISNDFFTVEFTTQFWFNGVNKETSWHLYTILFTTPFVFLASYSSNLTLSPENNTRNVTTFSFCQSLKQQKNYITLWHILEGDHWMARLTMTLQQVHMHCIMKLPFPLLIHLLLNYSKFYCNIANIN